MAVKESRLKAGTLTLGTSPGTEFGCQFTNVRIKSNYNSDDGVETLCGDMIAGATTLKSRALAGTVIQDFDDETGFINYCFTNELETVPFTFTPNQTGAPTYSGDVTVQVPDETAGGDVNTRLTSDIEWQMSNLDIVYPVASDAVAGDEAVAS